MLWYFGNIYRPLMVWINIPGFYGATVLYAMPWVFLALQVGITQKGKVQSAPGSYVLFLFIVYFSLWVLNALVHLIFVPRLNAHVFSWEDKMAGTYKNCPYVKGEMSNADYVWRCEQAANATRDEENKKAEVAAKAAADALKAFEEAVGEVEDDAEEAGTAL